MASLKDTKGRILEPTIFRNTLLAAAIGVLFISISACGSDSTVGHLWGQMGELFTLKAAIDDTLRQGESSLQVQNGKVITLGLVNTEFNDAEAPEREEAAGKIVDVLLERIATKKEFRSVDTVIVNFIHHEKKLLIVDVTITVDYYVYHL